MPPIVNAKARLLAMQLYTKQYKHNQGLVSRSDCVVPFPAMGQTPRHLQNTEMLAQPSKAALLGGRCLPHAVKGSSIEARWLEVGY